MSLREAINDVIADMEKTAKEHVGYEVADILTSYSKQLRIALRVAGPEVSNFPQQDNGPKPRTLFLPEDFGVGNVFPRKSHSTSHVEDSVFADPSARMAMRAEEKSPIIAEMDDETGTFIEVPADMPVGAKTFISGKVYVLNKDRKLVYSKEETEKIVKR